jgi:transposase
VGFITAAALAATVSDPSHFRSGRGLTAWLGLPSRQNASGGKPRLGRIAKKGDGSLRMLLVVGATAVLRHARHKPSFVTALLARKPARLASVALANKTARIAWALLAKAADLPGSGKSEMR